MSKSFSDQAAMPMIDEMQLAERLACFADLTPNQIKRRIRKMIREAGIEPYHAGDRWLIPEDYVPLVEQNVCKVRSKPTKEERPPMILKGPMTREQRFAAARLDLQSLRGGAR